MNNTMYAARSFALLSLVLFGPWIVAAFVAGVEDSYRWFACGSAALMGYSVGRMHELKRQMLRDKKRIFEEIDQSLEDR